MVIGVFGVLWARIVDHSEPVGFGNPFFFDFENRLFPKPEVHGL